MPKILVYLILISLVVALVPPALIARARTMTSERPRIHIIQDMDNQAKFKAQSAAATLDDGLPFFADGRSMRVPVAGTVARSELYADDHYARGVAFGGWATTFPREVKVDEAFIRHGQERFGIYCTPCHGMAGYGDGMIHQRAMELVKNPLIGNGTTWVQPKSMHDPAVRDQPVGQIFNTITNGVRNMAGYASQIPIRDRWAIVAYVETLQRSQNALPRDVPADQRQRLPLVDLMPKEETP